MSTREFEGLDDEGSESWVKLSRHVHIVAKRRFAKLSIDPAFDTDDAAQEALVSTLKRQRENPHQDPEKLAVFAAHNEIRDANRKMRASTRAPFSIEEHEERIAVARSAESSSTLSAEGIIFAPNNVEAEVEQIELGQRIEAASLEVLSPLQRTVFDLRSQGYPLGEIAERLGKTEISVRLLHHRAVKALRAPLADLNPTAGRS